MIMQRQKQLRDQETTNREAVDKLKEALHREESTVIAMRHELAEKDERVTQLTQRVRLVSG